MDEAKYIYINEHLISPSLICPICLNILEEPHIHVSCDSAFCRSCLIQLTEPICPICRCYWDDLLPEYNIYLPKANRLIRNMLDEIPVQCIQCHSIRNRGQFEHECQPNKTPLCVENKSWDNFQIILSALVILLFILFIYNYRHLLFETAVDRHTELINGTGIDIDKYLFEKIYYLIVKIIEYSMSIFIFNIFLWCSMTFYGDRFTSKKTSYFFTKFLEISIIINLITNSIYY
jgi:hypothetical protein